MSANQAGRAARLRAFRAAQGLSQGELGQRLQLDRSYISQLENGRKEIQDWVMERLDVLESEARLKSNTQSTPRLHGGPYWGTTNEAPVISWAQAGSDLHDFQDLCSQIDERIPTDCKDPNCFWIQLEGDSMVPKYEAGDYVIAMPNVEPQNGDLVLVKMVDGSVFFKLFHWSSDRKSIKLTSYNPLYPVMEFRVEEVAKLYPIYGAFRRIKGTGRR